MKKLIATLALVIPLLTLGACGSALPGVSSPVSTTIPPSVIQQMPIVDQIVTWNYRCGATMLSQIGNYANESVTAANGDTLISVNQTALQEVPSWQDCAGSNPDPEMSVSLTNAVANYRTAIIDILAGNYDAATVSVDEANADLQTVTNRVNELKGQ